MMLVALVAALTVQSSGTVTGRVVADESGDPIVNVRVALKTTSALAAPVTLTDSSGRFVLNTTTTRGTIAAAKTGFARAERAIGTGTGPIEIRLKRGAVVSGRVVDEFGEPVVNVRVVAQRDPRARLALAAGVSTDDRGEYRLIDLEAGTFVVAVTRMYGTIDPATLRNKEPDTIFYPGTSSAEEAQALQLASGQEQRRIDFAFPARRPVPPTMMVIRAAQMRDAGSPARTGPPPTGIVRGRVVDSNDTPVPNAPVDLLSPADVMQWQGMLTDDRGAFEFHGVAAGTFQVLVTKSGYASAVRTVTIGDGGVGEASISVPRFGVIAGRVVDELGEPIERVTVGVLQIQYDSGRRRLVPASATSLTDDLGRYRIYGLRPGQYVVTARGAADADLPGYAPVFFPGTTRAGDARLVPVGRAEEIGGIDLALSRAPTFTVSGRVLDSRGQPTTGGGLELLPGSTALVAAGVGARLGADGAFAFTAVTPGQYLIRADRGRKNGSTEGEFGTIPVVVADADVTGLTIAMSAGSTIHGHILFDSYGSSATTPPPASIEITPVPANFDLAPANPATADIHADATFDLAGINGPRRIAVTRWPDGWTLEAVRVGGIDVTDRPLPFGKAEQSLRDVEIVLTDRVSELAVTVVDDNDRPAPGTLVVAFSTDRARWYDESRYVRRAVADANGELRLTGLPFGTYYVAAVTDSDESWRDPAVLDALAARAPTCVVRDGQRQVLRLRTGAR